MNMDNIINMGEFIGAATGDKQHMLGKFLYFSLSNLLVSHTSTLYPALPLVSVMRPRFSLRQSSAVSSGSRWSISASVLAVKTRAPSS